MLRKKLFILIILFTFFKRSSTHPFYKTMPKELEHMYDKLKALEQEAIDNFKVAYPKVPACFWNDILFLSKQTQTWLADTAIDGEKTAIDGEKNEKKLFNQFVDECNRQGIDHRKIDFQYKPINDKEPFSIYITEIPWVPLKPGIDFDEITYPKSVYFTIDTKKNLLLQ